VTEETKVKAERTLHIDIPVKLETADVVLDIGNLVFDGDLPIAIEHLELLASDFSESNTKGHIIGIFHGYAAHVTLNDTMYNGFRRVTTGNPYKDLLAGLMKNGVQIELCGASAEENKWVNADLLSGIKVNTNAMIRLTQLGKQGYVQIKQ
jgi:intracellular sulfur oxidation DsrE/DsrF family protein